MSAHYRAQLEAGKKPQRDPGVITGEDSKVDQSFKEECDINRIMRKYERDPAATVPQLEGGQYLDVSEVGDFLEAQVIVTRAQQAFASLPSHVREEFRNDPGRMMEALADPKKADRMRELGLLNPLPPPPVKASPMEVVVVDGANFKKE